MTRETLRLTRTPLDNVVSNLRGEVGEILSTWVLWRKFTAESAHLSKGDPTADIDDSAQAVLHTLRGKLEDDIVARLSELGEKKIGRLNFHFATAKLALFQADSVTFSKFVGSGRLKEKRNYDISHRELPEQWSDHKFILIPYQTILKGVALALRLMKKIDQAVLGPAAPYLWRAMRKRRYDLTVPFRVKYMLLPYQALSKEDRAQIVAEEVRSGRIVWTEIATCVNGTEKSVLACRQWGVLLLGDRILPLDQYPLQELHSITVNAPDSPAISPGLANVPRV